VNPAVSFEEEIPCAMDALCNPALAVPPAMFPVDALVAGQPGLYAWWADDVARSAMSEALDAPLAALVYAGQAGATSVRSGRPSPATLRSRIKSNHIGGNTRSSTFRHTLASVLYGPLGLQVMRPGRLSPDSERKLSTWIGEHLRVAIFPYPNREQLGGLEHAVLAILDPPLNLNGMPPTLLRGRLQRLRRELVLREC
jgi:hypothetical protein